MIKVAKTLVGAAIAMAAMPTFAAVPTAGWDNIKPTVTGWDNIKPTVVGWDNIKPTHVG